MTVGAFSEWRKLPVSLSELCINTTLRCGQSFRWYKVPKSTSTSTSSSSSEIGIEIPEWRCVLHGRLISLKQDPDNLYYRTYLPPKSHSKDPSDPDTTLSILKHYFNLPSTPTLTTLYSQWSTSDPNFRKKAPQFTGIRILRQDAWEALIAFICSSNNNIARISQMVEKLCLHFGPFVAEVEGRAYHGFPSAEALADSGGDVEAKLRGLGFGYRAKYIHRTAVIVARERAKGWLDGLRNPVVPAFGQLVGQGDDGEMAPEGRKGYREAHEELLGLQGVGPKVADCVCLMGLGWGEAVPVDTHVWQIAQRDYKFGRGAHKSLTKATYDAVGNHFRKLWGEEAGWAHSVLFTADLRTFSDRLVTAKTTKTETETKIEMVVKDEKENVTIKTETDTTATNVTVKRAADELENGDVKLKLDLEESKTETTSRTTRRMSKRLRKG